MPSTERRPTRRHPFPISSTNSSLVDNARNNTTRSSPSSSSSSWIDANCGNIFYRPPHHIERPSRAHANRNPNLPLPLIGPRRSRPHSIHILTYPSGYVPKELRPKTGGIGGGAATAFRRRSPLGTSSTSSRKQEESSKRKQKERAESSARERREEESRSRSRDKSPIRPVLQKLFATISGRESGSSSVTTAVPEIQATPASPEPPAYSEFAPFVPEQDSEQQQLSGPGSSTSTSTSSSTRTSQDASVSAAASAECSAVNTAGTVDALGLTSPPVTTPGAATPADPPVAAPAALAHSLGGQSDDVIALAGTSQNRPAPAHLSGGSSPSPSLLTLPPSAGSTAATAGRPSTSTCTLSTSSSSPSQNNNDDMTGRIAAPPSAYHVPRGGHRNSSFSVRSAKSAVSSLVTEVPKPVASGSGVTCSIILAEPNVFLSGFDHEGHVQHGANGTALLRGKLQLNVTKNIKIKAVTLKLLGVARTEWPEGIPPMKTDLYEETSLRTQVLTFFNAINEGWSGEYGNSCTYKLKNSSANSSTVNLSSLNGSPMNSSKSIPTAKDFKRLSLQNQQARSFGKGDGNPLANAAQIKGYKVFYPGTYDYSFELPIDHHQLETIKLQYGTVKWELHANVERAGAFKPNLHGAKEVSIVRVPDQMSLEMSEPISISRQWEDQLHYDIVISGKSFPIGSKIPVAFKLTPLAKVQVHKLKVYLTETIEYHTNDRKVVRKDPGRKILLLEKSAGKPLANNYTTSEFRTVRGGELDNDSRQAARNMAARRRSADASRNHTTADPLPTPSENLLGDLDLGMESLWGSTEIEANVQIPTCEMMAKDKSLRLHPDCSWKNVNVYHWIKIVMRISRLDPDDPSGQKRRHFEISIDSPFTVLNCRATQANTVLPAYSDPLTGPYISQPVCGCPGAATVTTNNSSPNGSSNALSNGSATTLNGSMDNLPAPPAQAHMGQGLHSANPASDSPPGTQDGGRRPMHLLRAPSYNPPAFNDDTAPPALPELVTDLPTFEAANGSGTNNAPPMMTPPPLYDVVVGTPSVDGLADYFTRLADYRFDGPGGEEGESSDESDEGRNMRIHSGGRVNVVHPLRRPGGNRRMPSRSLDIAR